jgi:uncharacterized protein YkwD
MNETRTPRRHRFAAGIALALTLATVLVLSGAASASLRGRMLTLTNRSRRAHGLHALRMDRPLARDAKHHSVRMARRGSLFHSGDVAHYLRHRRWSRWGENVGETQTVNLRSLQRAFMRSPDHRYNILNRSYHRVGIGVERRDGRVWVTLDFYG